MLTAAPDLHDTYAMNRQQRRQAEQSPNAYYWRGRNCVERADYLGALAWATLGFAVPASTKIGFPNWERRP